MRELSVIISLILSQVLAIALFSIYPSESIEFHYPSFNQTITSEIKVVSQDSSWYTGADAVFNGSAFWLTPNPKNVESKKESNIGKIVYKNLIRFKNNQSDFPQKVASFNTSFTFEISTTCQNDSCGDGMAFFISTVAQAPNSSDGMYLGLLDPDAPMTTDIFFAVEFDTRKSSVLEDPSSSHIGIDINSLISHEFTDTSPNSSSPFYPELYLYNHSIFQAWIEYDFSTELIQVWMTNSSSSEHPSKPCLELTHDLSIALQDFMYVGFSAANKPVEDGMEGYAVHSWSFSIENFTEEESKHSKLIVSLAVALSIILALGTVGITLFLIKKKRRMRAYPLPSTVRTRGKNIILESNHSTLPRYSYKDLKRSAHGFTDQSKVGEGAFSSVYKATLADRSIVAIKRLKQGVRKEAEFSAEMNIISSIRHRNLLQLRGWCYEKGEAILVYPYMSNGNLESYLFGNKRGTLQSETRLKILAGVASALEYLHGNLGECVLHRDVKAANVLLTERFEAMLGDFGLARLIGHDEGAVTMTAVGTPGYIAPEVVYTGKATDKADVYSFGVLALEMAYGRPAIDRSSVQAEDARLVDYAWTLHQRNQLMEALDTCISMDVAQTEMWGCVLQVALKCCNPLPESRPTMRQVCQALKGDTALLMEPLPETKPSYPIGMNWPSTSGSSISLTSGSFAISTSEAGGFLVSK